MEWSSRDIQQIQDRGIEENSVADQLEQFRKGMPKLEIVEPCTISNGGIVEWDDSERDRWVSEFETRKDQCSVEKFVPASGAASRMFKHLYAHLEGVSSEASEQFISQIEKFPFADAFAFDQASSEKDLIGSILNKDGLGYGSLPKGMVLFHKYEDSNRTAFEEQLDESLGSERIHFTVPVQSKESIKEFLSERVKHISPDGLNITYSVQDPSTDTIAATPDNQPFRNDDGELLFRPAGHGALIGNLDKLESDIVFIKNIDNILPAYHRDLSDIWKKALAGYLMDLRHRVHKILISIEKGQYNAKEVKNLIDLFYPSVESGEITTESAFELLNRPIRVCGMVVNTGEPGGGPFWVRSEDGQISRQIVEQAQFMDSQKHLMQDSTHFNPVDLVCSLTDHHGRSYNLQEYVDHAACFISEKSLNGKPLRALELPGLWNGAMSNWNTVFVEVPEDTFNPVKTVNDLLKPFHQPK